MVYYPRDLRTHILRLLGAKTILYKAFGLSTSLGLYYKYSKELKDACPQEYL